MKTLQIPNDQRTLLRIVVFMTHTPRNQHVAQSLAESLADTVSKFGEGYKAVHTSLLTTVDVKSEHADIGVFYSTQSNEWDGKRPETKRKRRKATKRK